MSHCKTLCKYVVFSLWHSINIFCHILRELGIRISSSVFRLCLSLFLTGLNLFYYFILLYLVDWKTVHVKKKKTKKKHLCDFFSFQNFLEYSSSGTYCVNFLNLSSHRDYHSKIMDTKSLWDTLHIISTFLLIQWYLDLKIPSWVLWRQSCLFFFFHFSLASTSAYICQHFALCFSRQFFTFCCSFTQMFSRHTE